MNINACKGEAASTTVILFRSHENAGRHNTAENGEDGLESPAQHLFQVLPSTRYCRTCAASNGSGMRGRHGRLRQRSANPKLVQRCELLCRRALVSAPCMSLSTAYNYCDDVYKHDLYHTVHMSITAAYPIASVQSLYSAVSATDPVQARSQDTRVDGVAPRRFRCQGAAS